MNGSDYAGLPSSLPWPIPDSHHNRWANPKGEKGETPEEAMLTAKIVYTIKGDGERPCVNISWIIHFGIGRL
jgi:hypothetical protein